MKRICWLDRLLVKESVIYAKPEPSIRLRGDYWRTGPFTVFGVRLTLLNYVIAGRDVRYRLRSKFVRMDPLTHFEIQPEVHSEN